MNLKMIVDNEEQIFYIDTKEIKAIQTIKLDYYFLIYVYVGNHQIELKFKNEEEFKKALGRLKG